MLVVTDLVDVALLVAFFSGLALTVLAVVGGVGHLGGHGLLPHGHGHGVAHPSGGDDGVGALNLGSLLAFAAWFGGVGYLARNGLGWPVVPSLGVGVAAGLLVGWLVLAFLVRVLLPAEEVLDPADFALPGTLGRVIAPISPGGTGEVAYELFGRRCFVPAQGVGGRAIPRDVEVVVLGYARGIASVETWSALLGEEAVAAGEVRNAGPPGMERCSSAA